MRYRLPRLYAITDVGLSGLSHPEQVEAFCLGGASLIQLRDKELSPAAFYTQAKEALKVARRFRATLLINDRVDIAAAVGADGVHIGQDDLPAEAVRRVLGVRAIIGLSTHNLEQVRQGLLEPIDYLAIGPIFPTTTKAGHAPLVGLDGLTEIGRFCKGTQLVAIGGVTIRNCKKAFVAGADSVAMISWLTEQASAITSRTRHTLDVLSNVTIS